MAVQGVNSISVTKENNVSDIMDDRDYGECEHTGGNQSLTLHSKKFPEVSLRNLEEKPEELVIQSNLDGTYSNNIDKESSMGNRVSTGVSVLPASKIFPTNSSDSTEESLEGSVRAKSCLARKKKKKIKDESLGMPTKMFTTGSMFSGCSKSGKGDQETRSLSPTKENHNEISGSSQESQVPSILSALGDCNIPETLKRFERNTSEICDKSSVINIERKLSYLSVPPLEVPGSEKSDSTGGKSKLDVTNLPSEELIEGTESIVAGNKTSKESALKDPKNTKVNCHGWWKFDLGCHKQKLETKNRKFAFGKKE